MTTSSEMGNEEHISQPTPTSRKLLLLYEGKAISYPYSTVLP